MFDPIQRMREIRVAAKVKQIHQAWNGRYVFECQLCGHRTDGLIEMRAHWEATHPSEWAAPASGQGELL